MSESCCAGGAEISIESLKCDLTPTIRAGSGSTLGAALV
jgi:hypothetical protein